MIDLEDVKDYDLSRGVFDLYVDDIIMPVEKVLVLLENGVARLSQIDPYSVEDKEVFVYITKTTEFLKGAIQDVFGNDGLSSNIKTIDGYARKLVESMRENTFIISKISDDKFKENDLLEKIFVRDVLARYNKFENESVKMSMADNAHYEGKLKFEQEYGLILSLIESKKARKVFKNNLNIKPIN